MAESLQRYYTPEEYFALEEVAEYKSEYYNGRIYAMAGGSLNHARLTNNLVTLFNTAFFEKPCEVFNSDVKVAVQADNFYAYPDISVVCGEPELLLSRNDTITNPILIVEVLSRSTRNYDRGDKFMFYRALPSLQTYLLVHQDRITVEHYQKMDNSWNFKVYTELTDVIILPALQMELSLARLYNKVNLAAKKVARKAKVIHPIPEPPQTHEES